MLHVSRSPGRASPRQGPSLAARTLPVHGPLLLPGPLDSSPLGDGSCGRCERQLRGLQRQADEMWLEAGGRFWRKLQR